jgi:hypothetical protein
MCHQEKKEREEKWVKRKEGQRWQLKRLSWCQTTWGKERRRHRLREPGGDERAFVHSNVLTVRQCM